MTETRAASRTTGGGEPRVEPSRPEIEIVHHPAGIDLPVVGHVTYRTASLYGGLAVAGVVGVLEWPVAAAVGVAYALAKK